MSFAEEGMVCLISAPSTFLYLSYIINVISFTQQGQAYIKQRVSDNIYKINLVQSDQVWEEGKGGFHHSLSKFIFFTSPLCHFLCVLAMKGGQRKSLKHRSGLRGQVSGWVGGFKHSRRAQGWECYKLLSRLRTSTSIPGGWGEIVPGVVGGADWDSMVLDISWEAGDRQVCLTGVCEGVGLTLSSPVCHSFLNNPPLLHGQCHQTRTGHFPTYVASKYPIINSTPLAASLPYRIWPHPPLHSFCPLLPVFDILGTMTFC